MCVCVCANASTHKHVVVVCVCVCSDILMLPDGVFHQFHIKAELSGKTASYKLLKQHNKTLKGRAVCACLRVCVCIIHVCKGSVCH